MQDCKVEDKESRACLQGVRRYPGNTPLGEGSGVMAKIIVNGVRVTRLVLYLWAGMLSLRD